MPPVYLTDVWMSIRLCLVVAVVHDAPGVVLRQAALDQSLVRLLPDRVEMAAALDVRSKMVERFVVATVARLLRKLVADMAAVAGVQPGEQKQPRLALVREPPHPFLDRPAAAVADGEHAVLARVVAGMAIPLEGGALVVAAAAHDRRADLRREPTGEVPALALQPGQQVRLTRRVRQRAPAPATSVVLESPGGRRLSWCAVPARSAWQPRMRRRGSSRR